MLEVDTGELRASIGMMATDHDAIGEQRPRVDEVFAPEQHAAALAPSQMIVVGARGAGKSFWAGVLGQAATKKLAEEVYPQLGLHKLDVRYGYVGFPHPGAVSPSVVHARAGGVDHSQAVFFWQVVIYRCALAAVRQDGQERPISEWLTRLSDPEVLENSFAEIDASLRQAEKTALVIFDALDTLSRDWSRLTAMTDALFEAVWLLRAYTNVKAKIFIRPDQLNDEALRFVEMPKLRTSRIELNWSRRDLYGLFYCRLVEAERLRSRVDFFNLSQQEGVPVPTQEAARIRRWGLVRNEERQKRTMERLAGLYMGRGANKGATYPWTYKHLADGRNVVTPRSFLKLFVEAAKQSHGSQLLALTPEGIRHGLREASRTRVEQLALEYPWIKRALAPLVGLKVPCQRAEIHYLWRESDTTQTILKAAANDGFLPPYRVDQIEEGEVLLEASMSRIGVISYRPDGRADIPDLFRIAARMFRLGGVSHEPKR